LGGLLAALNSGTHFTVMPSPCAKLFRQAVQRYAATTGRQNIIHAAGVRGKFSITLNPVSRELSRRL
jgi:hypothetical protein